jgi:hypothetical protein
LANKDTAGGHGTLAGSGTGGGAGGGGGTVTTIASADGSVVVTNPGGPAVNLAVPAQFGPDTTVALPGDALALELILTAAAHVSQWAIKTLTAAATQATQVVFGSVGGSPGVHLPEGNLLGLDTTGGTGLLYGLPTGIRMFILGNQRFQLSSSGQVKLNGATPGIGNNTGGNFTLLGSGIIIEGRLISTSQGTTTQAGAGLLTLNSTLPGGNSFAVLIATSPVTYLATLNWGPGSRVTLSLPAAYTIVNAGGAPPANYAPIVLRAGVNLVTPAAGYVLDLVYDGTSWVQPG